MNSKIGTFGFREPLASARGCVASVADARVMDTLAAGPFRAGVGESAIIKLRCGTTFLP
jgi:hypothetical protein